MSVATFGCDKISAKRFKKHFFIQNKGLIQTFNLGTQIVCNQNQWNNIKISLGKEKFWSWHLVMDKFGCPKARSGLLYWQEDSLSYSTLITVLYPIWSIGHCKAWNEFGFQNFATQFEPRAFGFGVEAIA